MPEMTKEMMDVIITRVTDHLVSAIVPKIEAAILAATATPVPEPTPKKPTDGRKSRLAPPYEPGQRHPSAKLTEEQVREIRRLRADGFTGREIARAYGISDANVYLIASGRGWKHVTD